tara:strand:+ start:8 stop:253 length:246 start_codon:yes stop_codon:yes gene_type:complete
VVVERLPLKDQVQLEIVLMVVREQVVIWVKALQVIQQDHLQAQVEQELKVLEIFLVVLYHKVTQEDSHLKMERLLVVEEVE